MVVVTVRMGASGNVVAQVDVYSWWTVLDLKYAIEEVFPVALACMQRLLLDGSVLQDSVRLDECSPSGAADPCALDLELVVCDEYAAFAERLNDPEALVRSKAARDLGNFGARAAPHVPALVRSLQDEDERVVQSAAEALGKIGEAEAGVLKTLMNHAARSRYAISSEQLEALAAKLAEDRSHIRHVTTEALSRLGVRAAPHVMARLSHDKPATAKAALRILSRIGMPADNKAVDVVATCMSRPELLDNCSHQFMLNGIQRTPTSNMGGTPTAAFLPHLSAEDPNVRDTAARALEQLQVPAAPLSRALACLGGGPILDEEAQAAILEACGSSRPGSQDPAQPARAAAGLLTHEVERVRLAALEVLVRMGPDASDQAEAVVELLGRPELCIRMGVPQFLQKIGSNGRHQIPTLLAYIEHAQYPDAVLKIAVARSLGNICVCTKEQVDLLVTLARDADADVQNVAAGALGMFGTHALGTGDGEEDPVLEAFLHIVRKRPDAAQLLRNASSTGTQRHNRQAALQMSDRRIERRMSRERRLRLQLDSEDELEPSSSSSSQRNEHSMARTPRSSSERAVVAVGWAIRQMGSYPVQYFISKLNSPAESPESKQAVAYALSCVGKVLSSEEASLARFLHASDPEVRMAAATVFGNIEEPALEHLKVLASLLATDTDEGVRASAKASFRHMSAKLVVPKLVQLLDVAELSACRAAIAAIQAIPNGCKECKEQLATIHNECIDRETRLAATKAICTVRIPSSFFKSPDVGLRTVAATAAAHSVSTFDAEQIEGLIALLDDQAEIVRMCAARVFRQMATVRNPRGPSTVADHATKIAKYLEKLEGEFVAGRIIRRRAAQALGMLGAKAAAHVDAIAALLTYDLHDVQMQQTVIEALGGMGEAAAGHVAAIAVFLRHPTVGCRYSAARALAHIRHGLSPHANALADLLADDDSGVRCVAAHALEEVSPGTLLIPYLPLLAPLLKDRIADVRAAAMQTISTVGMAAAQYVEAAAALLEDSCHNVRLVTSQVFQEKWSHEPVVIAALGPLLESPNTITRRTAAKGLCLMGRNATHEESLEKLLTDSDWGVRCAAADALGQTNTRSVGKASALLALLAHPSFGQTVPTDTSTRAWMWLRYIVTCASEQGPPANHPQSEKISAARCSAARALGMIGGHAHVDQLAAHLHDPDMSVRISVVQALGRFGVRVQSHIPIILQLMADKEKTVRRCAAHSLERIFITCESQLDYIFAELDADSCLLMMKAFQLWVHVPQKAQVLAVFERCLTSDEPNVRMVAVETLSTMGSMASAFGKTLARFLNDPDIQLRSLAAEALTRIETSRTKDVVKPLVL